MSLMKRRTMTEKQKAAARANGRCSHGPASPEGRARIRATNLRHGLFSQAREVVLPSLGEDPERFEELRRGLYESWPRPSQRPLVESLAEAMWRLERIDGQIEELYINRARSLAEGNEFYDVSHPAAVSRLLSLEECTSREVIGIMEQLLAAEDDENEGLLPGLPQNMLKTKDQ